MFREIILGQSDFIKIEKAFFNVKATLTAL
jgi:hypothetical protein